MKSLVLQILILFSCLHSIGQHLLTKPNKFIDGRKEGEWSELNFLDTVDFNGDRNMLLYQHHAPKYIVAEGLYKNGLKEGFWKEYWTVKTNDTFKKGNIKSILEYKNDVLSGLDIEYYQSGKLKVIGHYEQLPYDTTFKASIPDQAKPELGLMMDTVFHFTVKPMPLGRWYFFLENGELYK